MKNESDKAPGTQSTFQRIMSFLSAVLVGLTTATLMLLANPGFAQSATGRFIANNTPRQIEPAEDLGPEVASKTISVTLWLRPQAESAADQLVEQLYDKSSANFHQWIREGQSDTALEPSAQQAAIVQKFLADRHLKVSAVGANNLFVKAEGTVRDVEDAFLVEIHQFRSHGTTYRANTTDPWIEEPAGSLVAAVSGMSEHRMGPHLIRAVDPDSGQPFPAVPLAVSPKGAFFSAQCFREPEKQTFTTSGGLPKATYFGNRYGQDITNTALGTLPPCGYQPSELQTAYGLNQLYAAGLDGAGQTIVIVDAIGSPTIAQDAELFSQVYGLPDLTAANFHVYFPGGQPPTPDQGWATETSLDVEWAHAVAPHANIALVIAPTPNDSDLQAAILFAVQHHLGNVISNSYGEAESDEPAALLLTYNRINRLAAARGISVHFSSGDGGDSNPSGITANLVLPGVSTPADSPWATAVGGTSLALDRQNHIAFQTGWGTNLTRIVDTVALGSPPVVPPLQVGVGFDFGSGGGSSGFFAKPAFQARLPGTKRLVPDISYLADPFTGVEIICDGDSCGGSPGPGVLVIGGTSLACPMFSALWAIANQRAGEGLGQAARLLYQLPHSAITDIVPIGSEDNVMGEITTISGSTLFSAQQLAQPLDNTRKFLSALYNSPFSTRWFVLTFGTDSSLTTAFGWDNVTGLGTPNGKRFVDAVAETAKDRER
jgi:subtilase family serine protease